MFLLLWFQIDTLSKVNHKNFVNLLGYCEEEEPFTKIMVFEKTHNFLVFLKKMKGKKLPNEEIIQYYCCYHWCGLILGPFHYLTKKKKKTDLQIAILENTHRFLVFLRKMKANKLRRSYQMNINHYLYPNDYDPSTCTFSFNMHIFDQ